MAMPHLLASISIHKNGIRSSTSTSTNVELIRVTTVSYQYFESMGSYKILADNATNIPCSTSPYQHEGENNARERGPSVDVATSPILRALQRACVILPHQAILEKFVHHNPLLHLQDMEFEEATAYINRLEMYMSPGERTALLTGRDPRKLEKEAVLDLAANFLDRGAAKWAPAFRHQGFLSFFARLEGKGFTPWRAHARIVAAKILEKLENTASSSEMHPEGHVDRLAEEVLRENLQHFGIPPDEWENCLISMMSKLRGWAGMFHRMEEHPDEAPEHVRVSLVEFCAVQSIIVRSAIEFVATRTGSWKKGTIALKTWLDQLPPRRERIVSYGSVSSFSRIADDDQSLEQRLVLQEWFEQKLINAITAAGFQAENEISPVRPDIQFITCIDDRMGSFRRQLEQTRRTTGINVETFGVAGYFGLPMRFKSFSDLVGRDMTPDESATWVVEEVDDVGHDGDIDRFKKRAKIFGQVTALFEVASFSPLPSILISLLAPVYVLRIFLMGFAPVVEDLLWGSLRSVCPLPRTTLKYETTAADAATALAATFRSTGLAHFISPVVVLFGHGASSVNNPYFAAYNCGACAGKKCGPNARMFAQLANDTQVRLYLERDHGVVIPAGTFFIAGEHDTTRDTVSYYDVDKIPFSLLDAFENIKRIVSLALGNNALERCHRFYLADAKTPSAALRHVLQRATDYGEARPELNHATNAGVVVGRRFLTHTSFFDRRVFLTSYDPFVDDDNALLLEEVLVSSLKVCSGINLEYLFSTLATERYGAGSKAPLNIVGNIGMQQGSYGDLRTGLPSQMVDMHIPVRSFFIVDAPYARVQQVLQRHPELELLLVNHWIRLATRDPETGQIYRYIDRSFVPVPLQEVTSRKHLTMQSEWKTFQPSWDRGIKVRKAERTAYFAAILGMVLSFVVPLTVLDSSNMMNPQGAIIAACATGISLPVLALSRRYMHGENLFARTSLLSSGLVLGFNYIAMAPSLEDLVEGWCLFGLASAFLIGTYNDRVTVQSNALFAFACYRFADMALLTSIAFGGEEAIRAGHYNPGFVAGGVITAAMFKSSQFPLTALFSRSMEGPTPTSALGYAGLSAHVGLVLLSSTESAWMPYVPARAAIAFVGIITAVHAGFVSQIHADRKGAVAYATSSTIGLLYVIMAAGYVKWALFLALGHSSLRMGQILRASHQLQHEKNLVADLGASAWPKIIPDCLFEFCWSLHRWDTDANLVHVFDHFTEPLEFLRTAGPQTRLQKAVFLVGGLAFAGFPFTPLSVGLHALVIALLPKDPLVAILLMVLVFSLSMMAMRFIQLNLL